MKVLYENYKVYSDWRSSSDEYNDKVNYRSHLADHTSPFVKPPDNLHPLAKLLLMCLEQFCGHFESLSSLPMTGVERERAIAAGTGKVSRVAR